MSEFTVVAAGPTRPRSIREARYGRDALGGADTRGALCYTGLATSPGFENSRYTRGFRAGPVVPGRPTVVSGVGGGNATLAWEPRPGVIAYVGYSGNAVGDAQIAALAGLAQRAVILSADDWTATRPGVNQQNNAW